MKKLKKNLLIINIILIVVSLLLFNLFIKNGGFILDGDFIPYSVWQSLKASLMTMLLAIPFMTLVMSLLVNIIPYNKTNYTGRFKLTYLWVWIVLNAIAFLYVAQGVIIQYFVKADEFKARQEKIRLFEEELLAYKDSALYYMDLAIKEAEPDSVNDLEVYYKYIDELKKYEYKIDSTSTSFHKTLKEKGLIYKDYIRSIKTVIEPQMDTLSEKWLEFEKLLGK